MDFANRIGTPEAKQLSQALLSCVKYNKSTISHAYGVSIYFPYESLNAVKTAITTYNQLGMDEATPSASPASPPGPAASSPPPLLGSYGSLGRGGLDLSSLLGAYLGSGSGGSYGSSGTPTALAAGLPAGRRQLLPAQRLSMNRPW